MKVVNKVLVFLALAVFATFMLGSEARGLDKPPMQENLEAANAEDVVEELAHKFNARSTNTGNSVLSSRRRRSSSSSRSSSSGLDYLAIPEKYRVNRKMTLEDPHYKCRASMMYGMDLLNHLTFKDRMENWEKEKAAVEAFNKKQEEDLHFKNQDYNFGLSKAEQMEYFPHLFERKEIPAKPRMSNFAGESSNWRTYLGLCVPKRQPDMVCYNNMVNRYVSQLQAHAAATQDETHKEKYNAGVKKIENSCGEGHMCCMKLQDIYSTCYGSTGPVDLRNWAVPKSSLLPQGQLGDSSLPREGIANIPCNDKYKNTGSETPVKRSQGEMLLERYKTDISKWLAEPTCDQYDAIVNWHAAAMTHLFYQFKKAGMKPLGTYSEAERAESEKKHPVIWGLYNGMQQTGKAGRPKDC